MKLPHISQISSLQRHEALGCGGKIIDGRCIPMKNNLNWYAEVLFADNMHI